MPPASQVSVRRGGPRRWNYGGRVDRPLTLNDRPPLDTPPGSAPTPPPSGSSEPLPKNAPSTPLLISSIRVGDQAGSEIVPGWALPIAAAFVKVTLPKRVNGNGVQRPAAEQVEGASAIHSAEETSSVCVGVIVRENRVCRVRFFRLIVTVWPFTSTAALMRSPGRTLSGIGTDGAGTISHQDS